MNVPWFESGKEKNVIKTEGLVIRKLFKNPLFMSSQMTTNDIQYQESLD